MTSRANALLTELCRHRNEKNIAGMARFGIVSKNVLGLPTPYLRDVARNLRRDHALALELWSSGIYEARILAALIADPEKISKSGMTAWATAFDNWAICDGVCIHFFRKSPYAHDLVKLWNRRKEEYVRRAGFTMIATLAVHDKSAADSVFRNYLKTIASAARDDRPGVRKAVNWALRQIGKRNRALNAAAIRAARKIHSIDSPAARWIASDALRELESPAVQKHLRRKSPSQKHARRS